MKKTKLSNVYKTDLEFLREVMPGNNWSNSKRINVAVEWMKMSKVVDKFKPEISDTKQDRLMKKLFNGRK